MLNIVYVNRLTTNTIGILVRKKMLKHAPSYVFDIWQLQIAEEISFVNYILK